MIQKLFKNLNKYIIFEIGFFYFVLAESGSYCVLKISRTGRISQVLNEAGCLKKVGDYDHQKDRKGISLEGNFLPHLIEMVVP